MDGRRNRRDKTVFSKSSVVWTLRGLALYVHFRRDLLAEDSLSSFPVLF